jgi:hypothetical protein
VPFAAPAPAVPAHATAPAADVPLASAGDGTLRGIGGWLVLVAIGLIARPVLSVVSLVQLAPALSADAWYRLTDPAGTAYHPLWAPLLLFEVAANVALAVASVLLIVLFFQQRRMFPRTFVALLAAQVVVTLVDAAGTALLPADEAGPAMESIELAVSTLSSSVVWILYLLRSRRVKLTFVR